MCLSESREPAASSLRSLTRLAALPGLGFRSYSSQLNMSLYQLSGHDSGRIWLSLSS